MRGSSSNGVILNGTVKFSPSSFDFRTVTVSSSEPENSIMRNYRNLILKIGILVIL